MYDMHYDLLSILYSNFMGNKKTRNIEKIVKDCKKIYNFNNIIGGVINLYFMTPLEMEKELGIDISKSVDVTEMFKISLTLIDLFKKLNVINPDTDFLYSIEGCDYIKDENELNDLYNLGLRSILLVWNNKNKYGSGNNSEGGLTFEGKKFLRKAIDLGIVIDLSHANQETFDNMVELIVEEQAKGKDPIVIASHSNCRNLCDRKRNLTDEHLIKLRDIGGYIGLFSNRNFVSKNTDNENLEERKISYLKHIDHVLELGFSEDKILLSTDDMNFNLDPSYHGLQTFELENIASDLRNILENKYNIDFVNKIMIDNAKNLIKKVNRISMHNEKRR